MSFSSIRAIYLSATNKSFYLGKGTEEKSDGRRPLSHGLGPGITPLPPEKAVDAIFELSYFARSSILQEVVYRRL